MSEAFVEAFARAHRASQAAFNEADFAKAFASLAPDIEWDVLPQVPDSSRLRGREAVIRYFQGVSDAVDWRLEAQEFTDVGHGRILVHQRGTAVGRSTSLAGLGDFFQIWEIAADGLVVRVREFERREDALDAAGISG